MKHIVHPFEFDEYPSSLELDPSDQELLEAARRATATSYAPYSHYHVGAAVKLENGTIVTGSNQENISFPAGLCAERVALFSAVSKYPGVAIESIAITAKAENFEVPDPVPPCGICRQAIAEYEMKFDRKIRILLSGEKGKVLAIESMELLLPLMFREKGLLQP